MAKFGLGILVLFLALLATPAEASILDDLKARISGHSETIKKLDEEIKRYQGALYTTRVEKSTLTTEIQKIDQTDKQLTTQLKSTEGKITSTAKTIEKLGEEIKSKEEEITEHQLALGESLRSMAEQDQVSIVEGLLAFTQTSELWHDLAVLDQFQGAVGERILNLDFAKRDLNSKKVQTEAEKKKLGGLKEKLADEKKIVVQNKQTKNTLLKETQSKETAYQQLLADRLKKKQEVEAEIMAMESQIKTIVDPSKLPSTGSGTLKWPLAKIIITQYFGNTAFASANAQVYNGKGHNGVDFGIPVGTPVMTARGGTVMGAGDTDLACRGASYGKWVLIKHDNGLASLYAHLSLIKVVAGETVQIGQVIGYSGNTGYSTGPHLHFTVYAAEAVKISTLQSKVPGCGTYTLPLSPQNGYLNPLSYL